jgi:hypothetical protein
MTSKPMGSVSALENCRLPQCVLAYIDYVGNRLKTSIGYAHSDFWLLLDQEVST